MSELSFGGQNLYPQQSSYARREQSCSREVSELSSITLETDEEEALHAAHYTYPPDEEPNEEVVWGANLAKLGAILMLVAAACAVGAMVLSSARPARLSAPELSVAQHAHNERHDVLLTARQLLESSALTDLTVRRLQGEAQFNEDAKGLRADIRAEVADNFRDVALEAGAQLDTIQLSAEQKNAILRELDHMSENNRMQGVGIMVAQAMAESASRVKQTDERKRYVLRKLQSSLPEVRRLRDEVIPASLRRPGTTTSLSLEQLRITRVLPLLGHNWNFEVDADLTAASRDPKHSAERRLAAQRGGKFITTVRKYGHEANTALDTLQKDLDSSVVGLHKCLSEEDLTSDSVKMAETQAYNTMKLAVNAMDTVSSSLRYMMTAWKDTKTNSTRTHSPTGTMRKDVFKNLKNNVAELQRNCAAAKKSYQNELSNMKTSLDSDSRTSVEQVLSATQQVQQSVKAIQQQTIDALEEFKILHQVYDQQAGVADTVRLYASSVFDQLGSTFNVQLPDVGPANDEMAGCVQKSKSFTGDLKCKLIYAKTCLELMQGGSIVQPATAATDFQVPLILPSSES